MRDADLWVDIDGIEMTEGNYIELRRAAGGMSVSITTMMEFCPTLFQHQYLC